MSPAGTAILLLLCLTRPLSAQVGLPSAIRTELVNDFPGWRFATLSAEHSNSLPSGASPGWIKADFDGDGLMDYAVQIVEARAQDSTQRVFAFLRRGPRYRRILLQAFPPSGIAYLLRAPRGQERPDFAADPNGTSRVRLKHDGLDLILGESGALTCVYASAGFRCIISGD